MSKHRGLSRWFWVLLTMTIAVGAKAQEAPRAADPAAAEEAREQRSMERFLSLLEKNPRKGTALDRVYGYHVERGSLDTFIKTYRDRVANAPGDGPGWLILGLLEGQRGQDAASVTALRQAETARPTDPLPPYYLGQALVLVGQPEQAAAAFERALERKPARNDLLEIFQALGRVYQRTQKTDQALQVWNRLETLFPNDPRVQEQIASALAEENQPAVALPRFEALAKKAADPFRQVQLAMQAADLKVRLGRSDDALRDFETMLGKLRPDSWLHREVRRKVEEVFLRNDDQPGLVSYYERWTKRDPEDIEALVRLGRTLASMGRAGEALPWFEKAIKLAPTRRDLRLALISQLAGEQKFAEAAQQYEALDQADPNNPDTLRDWGALVLRDTTRPAPERKAAASAVWRKMLVPKPNDPVTTAQVADLLRQAELTDDALALYRKAAELAPNNPQYHEYIGEFLHNLKRPDEAKSAWARIADGPSKNPRNLARLAEVLAGFGYVKEAIPALTEAVKLEADNFDFRLKLASYLHRLERFDDAEIELAAARKLAFKDEEKDAVLDARVKNDGGAHRLTERIASLQKDAESGNGSAEKWENLARYLEADGKLPEAVRASNRAIEVEPRSVRAWALAARVRESAGSLGDAADALNKLTEIDRRNRAEYLTAIAKLESRLGRIDVALKAGRDLLAAAPGNPDNFEFFAQLCFQLGKAEEGLDTLRRAMRVNPNDTKIVLTLADTLAGQFQTEEAVEMYWRAFDRSGELDQKVDVVRRLTELYLQRNQFDRLLTRLEHQNRDDQPAPGASHQRDVAICLAQAYASSGDMGSARTELERLLASNARDPQILAQLSKLAEEEGDLESAARYQKQCSELAPSDEGWSRLSQLYTRFGEIEEAQAVWSKMAAAKGDSSRAYQAMDSLLANQKPQPVLEITESLLRKNPSEWESIYRQALALADLDRAADADRRFRDLLALPLDDDLQSTQARARARKPTPQTFGPQGRPLQKQATLPLEDRLTNTYFIRVACRLDPPNVPQTWSPDDFGQARMAALGFLASRAQTARTSKFDELSAALRANAEKPGAGLRAMWDWFYFCQVMFDNAGLHTAAKALVRAAPADPVANWAYLYSLGGRQLPLGRAYSFRQLTMTLSQEESIPALDRDELDQMMSRYYTMRSRRPELAQSLILIHIADELHRAGRADDEQRFYRETIDGSTQIGEVAGAIVLAARRGDAGALILLADRYDRLHAGRTAANFATGLFTFSSPALSISQGMSVCAGRKAYGDVIKLVDYSLTAARRRQESQTRGANARLLRARLATYAAAGVRVAHRIWVGSGYRSSTFTYPTANEYLDTATIDTVRTAYELYKRDDLVSDLIRHFREQLAAARSPSDAAYPRLALSSLAWWSDDKDEAIAQLTSVVEDSRPESELRIDLAELLEQERDLASALSLLDEVQPLDNFTLRRREEVALRVALAAGNVERAKMAAERLFGLRLDTDTQVRLAGQMHQLGQHALAEAVLGRARRRAGGKASALVGLMNQYQRQQKTELATQVAMQILRSTAGSRSMAPNTIAARLENTDAARTTAISVLARSGRLPALIDRANEQLRKTPNAFQIHQALADYYRASGQRDKARAELVTLSTLRPDDASLRLDVIQQLVDAEDFNGAIAQFRLALKKQPAQASMLMARVQTGFEQAGRSAELLELIDAIDLRSLGSGFSPARTLQGMPDEPKVNERVVSLFRKAWDTFPQDRPYLFAYTNHEALWQMPDIYAYARAAMVPTSAPPTPYVQWYPFLPYSLPVRSVTGLARPQVLRLLDIAARENKLDDLISAIDQAPETSPRWDARECTRLLALCRAGRYEECKRLTRVVIDKLEKDPLLKAMSYHVYIFSTLADELAEHSVMRPQALALYENAVTCQDSWLQFRYDSEKIPMRRLVDLYVRDGRVDDARRALVNMPRFIKFDDDYNEELVKRYRAQALAAIGRQLVELDFAGDAAVMFAEGVALTDGMDTAVASAAIPNLAQLPRLFRDGLNSAIAGLSRVELAAIAGRLIADAAVGSPGNHDQGDSQSNTNAPRDQALNLVTLIHPRELDKAAVRSLFAESLTARSADQLAALDAPLEALNKAHADDLSVAIAMALRALAGTDSRRIEPALDRLNRLVERSPLEALGPGMRANARQRNDAARQVPLWLVARACEGQTSATIHELGDRLAARALEAAARQSEPRWRLAILREQGQRAFDQHDRARAEATWSRMLSGVLAGDQKQVQRRPLSRPAGARARAKVAPDEKAPAHAPARAKANSQGSPATTGAAVTRRRTAIRLARFQQPAARKRPAPAAEAPSDPAAAEEAREQRSMERFLSLLEKNPRKGTALDRVYGYHVERGTLDTFIKGYRDRVDKDPKDGTASLILGLLEGQRGQDAASVTALRQAEAARPTDPLPPYYLGQALVLVGQPEQAAAAFERALERKPARNDLLEIFQALGRVYQRTQKTDQALQVWNRLETLFPNDPRVQEQIASALAEENQPAVALPRFEALAKKAADPFRQVQLAMQAADLKVRLGRSDDALRDFETMLAKLRPDSWLHREVRRKIEEVFLRNDDQPGLVSYYERWTKREPEDIEALVRLGRTLASMGRAGEALPWFEKAIKLAPTRRDLRLALISQLVGEQKFAEAAQQYEALDQADPNNPDTLRDWGALVLRDTTKPAPERKAAAAAVWRKMLVPKPNDPVTTAQVADLLRQAELTDDALALYRKAAELAPNNPQYREYIGEFLHNLKRPDEAKAAWARIAEGANKNAKNLARLAEVLAGFGYVKEAMPPLADAVKLDADNFDYRLRLANYLHRLERFDDVEAELKVAHKLAEKEEEKDAVVEARVKNDLAANRVPQRIEALRKELEGAKPATAEQWDVLARYLEADGKLPEAVGAVEKAIQAEPRSIAAWTLAARVRESAGNLADAGDALRRLAEIDRRNRTEHLMGIAKIETRLGRIDAALKAGRDLLAAAPGNPENYEFFAQLCFQLGRADEGLDALRRAVRVNPNDTKITLTLAETLAGQYRTDEAIEMYWRAFDKAEDLDGKLGTVSRLTELYLQRNQLDRLLTRLQHQERDARPGVAQPQQRDVAICMAQAYASSGDLGSARSELERLLASNTRDTQLLQQLSKLAEEEGDLESAARYQKQLNELTPSDDGASRLAQLYSRFGELEEAQAVWSKMASGKSEAYRIFGAIDSLLGNKKPLPVMEITESMIRKDPHDWEALYRQGLALAGLDKQAEAARRFQEIVDLSIDDDEKSAAMKARSRDPKLQAAGARPSAVGRQTMLPLETRMGAISQIRMACKLDNREMYSSRLGPQAVWSPTDFGQARMAALGWLVSLADKSGKEKGQEAVARIRKASEKTPANIRALWDWFYLCLLRYDNAAAFRAGQTLSRAAAADPLAAWAYLYAMGGRQQSGQAARVYVGRGVEAKDSTPPLEKAELDHALSCYASLRSRRPELAQALILRNVDLELKRAKRVEDEERFYRDSIAGATQLAQIAGSFGLAAERGDADALIQLADRLERLQSGRAQYYSTGTFYFAGTALSFSQGMSVCAQRKAYANVLRLLDHELAAARRRQEHQSPGAARSARTRVASQVNVSPQYQIWVGKTTRFIQIPFPTPNEYVDSTGIQLLRTAYELYKRDDLFSDLSAHFRRQAEQAKTPADAVYARLALAAFYWWNDDKENAIAEFTKVAEGSKAESELRLDLAELLEQQGERADALTLADSVQPLDNTTMKRREELALRLSVLTGDLERARQAAERLFGLRLDTETQVRLAGQMSQLGQHELAEAVLGRARRRAGNKATALVGLMLQYQRQGKLDVAVQVAMQILRSTTATRQTNPNYSPVENPDASRTAAIGVLARSGRLTQLIERAGEQLKKTPNVISIHQALADYFKAAGQRDKARDELAKIIALRPDDSNLRLQVAQQLAQEGQAAAAIEHYKAILKRDPAVLGRNFYQVQSTFQQANKTGELMDLLDQVDLRKFGQPYMVFNLISNLFFDNTLADRAVPLFKKAWEAFPDERSQLISYVSHDQIWQMPEMYEYGATSLIPQSTNFVPATQWTAFSQVISYSNDGRVNTVVSRLLDLASAQGKLDELATRVEASRKAVPEWTAGEVLQALIDCRLGRFDQASRSVRQFLDRTRAEGLATSIFWVIAAELERHGPTRDLAVTAYEASLSRDGDDPYSRLSFDNGPAKRLVNLYERDKRPDDARRVLVQFASVDLTNFGNYPAGYIEQMKMAALGTAAAKLQELGFAADAISLYNQSLALAREIPAGAPTYYGNTESMIRQYRDGLTRAIDDLKPEDLAASLTRALAGEAAAAGSRKSKPRDTAPAVDTDQTLDLMIMVHPRELDLAAVRSLVADAIAAPTRTPAATGDSTSTGELSAAVESARQKRPGDLSVAITDSLLALASADAGRIETATGRLNRLVEKTPLEPLAEGTKANARQRLEAARQIPLWLVARACRTQKKESADLQKLADALTARALLAAERQTDNQILMAMLREQGQMALDRGDRRAAEAAWSRMLALVVTPLERRMKAPAAKPAPPIRPVQPKAPSGGRSTSMRPAVSRALIRRVAYQAPSPGQAPGAAAPARATDEPATKAARPRTKGAAPADRAAAGPGRANLPILTLDRFEQAMQIARLAAVHDLPDLSVRAVRESLRAGPPVVPANPNERRRVVVRTTGAADEGPVDQAAPRVIANLVEIERLWRQHHVADLAIYEALRDVVLPAGRPAEVFLYATPLTQGNLRHPQSLGMLLATAAIRGHQVDDLKRAIARRQTQAMAELPATVLTTQLALAANDQGQALTALAALGSRLKRDSSRNTSEQASLAALPALSRPEPQLARAAITVLDGCARALENSGQPEPLGSLLLLLARRQFQLGDADAGRKRLESYLEATEKSTINYGGDYALYVRKQNLANVAAELARASLWPDAFQALGRFVDAPAYSGGDPPVDDPLIRISSALDGKPAAERYEILRTWTMPTKDRQVARILTSTRRDAHTPAPFRKAAAGPHAAASGSQPANEQTVVSTAIALIDAARQSGKLDELAALARTIADPKAPQQAENAEVLYLLIELARGKGDEVVSRIKARLTAIENENDKHRSAPAVQPGARVARRATGAERFVFPWTDYLVSRASLASDRPTLHALGVRFTEALIDRAQETSTVAILPALRTELARAKVRQAGAPAAVVLEDAGMENWHPAASSSRFAMRSTAAPALWLSHQGLVAHVAGHDQDFLLFDYPISGTYEFSVEGYIGSFAESGITHNGLVLDIFDQRMGGSVFPVGQSEIIRSQARLTRPERFNRLGVQATPTKVRYSVNGHVFYEDDDPSPTSPWLGLFTAGTRQTVWRAAALTGAPTIPQEVPLSQGDRLEGWMSSFLNETQPPRRTEESTDQWGNVNRVSAAVLARRSRQRASARPKKTRPAIKLDDFDWAADDGVIHGRRIVPGAGTDTVNASRNLAFGASDDPGTDADQSLLTYFRPLRDRDELTYEFFYEPGQVVVHPTIDRLAFLLEPAGIKVHWITAKRDDTGLTADNIAEEPESRRGPSPLPLAAGQWNKVKLTLADSKVLIELNGQPIYERALEPGLGRQFGFFHFKDQTAAQARNVVLRGRWPEKLSSERLADLFSTVTQTAPADPVRRARHDVIGESFFALEASALVEKARTLPADARWKLLSDWVLPSPDHPVWRLEGDFTPSFPAPPLALANGRAASATGITALTTSRQPTGGEPRAPAIELVESARASGKLDELIARVEAIKVDQPEHRAAAAAERARMAFLGMIAVARGDDAAAGKAVESIKPLLEKSSPDQPAWERWPEMCLAAMALSRPALNKPAVALVTTASEHAARRKPTAAERQSPQEAWMRQLKHLLAQFQMAALAGAGPVEARQGEGPPELWAQVTQTRGETRGQGYPIPHWIDRAGQWTHYPGHDRDLLYLAVPLRGEFQIDAECSARPGQSIRLAYGGLAVGPKPDLKALDHSLFGRPLGDLVLNPALEKPGDSYAFRLTVKGGRLTASINGRKVHDAPAPPDGDPWVTILSQGMETGTVRQLAITGSPQVPEKINLSTLPDLAGWLADDYLESTTGDNADWDKRGDEITARRMDDAPGLKQESLLKHHRPLLEDGQVTYEFYYEPGKVLVHPALDRLAFMIEPEGVKIHRLTNGPFETTALAPDNLAEEPENRRGPASLPLKLNAWNRLVLKLTGDRAELVLNDQSILERTLEPTNQRFFGLFHFADETEVRARNVVYEGKWPQSLPPSLRPRQ